MEDDDILQEYYLASVGILKSYNSNKGIKRPNNYLLNYVNKRVWRQIYKKYNPSLISTPTTIEENNKSKIKTTSYSSLNVYVDDKKESRELLQLIPDNNIKDLDSLLYKKQIKQIVINILNKRSSKKINNKRKSFFYMYYILNIDVDTIAKLYMTTRQNVYYGMSIILQYVKDEFKNDNIL